MTISELVNVEGPTKPIDPPVRVRHIPYGLPIHVEIRGGSVTAEILNGIEANVKTGFVSLTSITAPDVGGESCCRFDRDIAGRNVNNILPHGRTINGLAFYIVNLVPDVSMD